MTSHCGRLVARNAMLGLRLSEGFGRGPPVAQHLRQQIVTGQIHVLVRSFVAAIGFGIWSDHSHLHIGSFTRYGARTDIWYRLGVVHLRVSYGGRLPIADCLDTSVPREQVTESVVNAWYMYRHHIVRA